jgi:hypothetical protein
MKIKFLPLRVTEINNLNLCLLFEVAQSSALSHPD